MNIYQKLQMCRTELQRLALKKSGMNKFAGFSYFELADFLPHVNDLFEKHGLCGIVSYTQDTASLTLVNTEVPEETIIITSPMSTAALKGCHEIQNLGAVETYERRYLYVTALEITESDALDATTGNIPPDAHQGEGKKPSNSPKNEQTTTGAVNPAPVESQDDIQAQRIKDIDTWLLEMAGGVEPDYKALLKRVTMYEDKGEEHFLTRVDQFKGKVRWTNKTHNVTKDLYAAWKNNRDAKKLNPAEDMPKRMSPSEIPNDGLPF